MTEEEIKEKVRLNRIELLKKARQAKAEKKAASKQNNNVVEEVLKQPEEIPQEQPQEKPKKTRAKKEKVQIEVKELKTTKKELAPEVIEEVVRIPANRRKKIVKRTIEIEESETDEEVVEEIVRIPKMKKEIKYSRDEMKNKLINQNLDRLNNELFQ